MRLLVTGARGQLGSELRRCIASLQAEIGAVPPDYEGAFVDYVDRDELDITQRDAVESWFAGRRYDLVINCAAMTDVDRCETDEDEAFRVNAGGPSNLARATARQNAKILQVSTDYVFSGSEPGARLEGDVTHPASAYGRSKLAGELAVMKENPRYFIVRTAWLYGYSGRNFVKTMRSLGKTHDEVMVVGDQRGNPTSANDLAYEILKIALTEDYGVYHCTGKGVCSWAEFAAAIMEGSGLECRVVPVTSAQYKELNPRSADRPKNSSLENRHLANTIGDEMRFWREALDEYLMHLPEMGKVE
ncbi:dTDP-4-dehydrorhamnose reductase [Adlercreutzia sp. ZJ473]|uniref:dTDP-4-dehydrorhamnose reductase n=1 Tax=Adlercreutzia sp. ZJ473 TaxID=2722822 RepID=UPI001555EED0|nr:dTDP-4-dehydrorhamnose reductase [Adlercreutzia sp. ZJ473]